MEFFISTLLFGISVGGQYALIAIGYTMVYGILRLINFAHGDVFMVAGLMGIYLTSGLTPYLPPAAVIPASLVLVLVLTVALGFCIERVAYKPLRSAPRMSVMISAIGVSYLLQNTATYVTGGQPMTYPTLPFLGETVTIAGTPIKWVVILTPFLVVALVIVLTQLINHTKIGMAMRAVAKDFETSQLMGIKINSVISATFVIGSALAAVGSMPEGLRGSGVRGHRLHPRGGDRGLPHRHLREFREDPPLRGGHHLCGRLYLRPAHHRSGL